MLFDPQHALLSTVLPGSSYGVLWLVLLFNVAMAAALARLLLRVRSRWDDAAPVAADPAKPSAVPMAAPESAQAPAGSVVRASGRARSQDARREGDGGIRAVRTPPDLPRSPHGSGPRPIPTYPALPRSRRLDAVSVIIPTADSPDLLLTCLSTLRQAQGYLGLQILCVFSEKARQSQPICSRYDARVLQAKGPFCFSKSVNLGLRHATEPVCLLLNNDVTWHRHGDLERLVRRLEQHPELAALGPVSDNIGSERQRRDGPHPGGGLIDPRYALIGHCVLFRRELLEGVGYLDEAFQNYGYDEVDWFWRLRRQGYRWAVDESVWVHHAGTASFSSTDVRDGIGRSRALFTRKWDVDPIAPGVWDWPAPLVSIVISSHNTGPWLDRCMQSIRACGLTDYEVVVADDGSTDETVSILQRWSTLLPLKFAAFSKAENVARAKNRALRMASGRYIALMDADDELHPDRIPLLFAALRDTGADLAYGGFEIRRTFGEERHVVISAARWDAEQYATAETNWVCPCATLYRRSILEAGLLFDESLPAFEDYEWVLATSRAGFRITAVPGPPCHIYHQRGNTTLNSYEWIALRDGIRAKHAVRQPSAALADSGQPAHEEKNGASTFRYPSQ